MVGASLRIEAFEIEAFEEGNQGYWVVGQGEAFEVFDAHHHVGVLTALGDGLRAFAAGTAAEVAEPGFGVFQFSFWVGVRGW